MDTTQVVASLNDLLPDSRILGDVRDAFSRGTSDRMTTLYVDSKPRTVPADTPFCIIKKAFSMAYLPEEQSTVNVCLAVGFDPAVMSSPDEYDPEKHCFGIMQYGCQHGELLVLAFQTDYWYC